MSYQPPNSSGYNSTPRDRLPTPSPSVPLNSSTTSPPYRYTLSPAPGRSSTPAFPPTHNSLPHYNANTVGQNVAHSAYLPNAYDRSNALSSVPRPQGSSQYNPPNAPYHPHRSHNGSQQQPIANYPVPAPFPRLATPGLSFPSATGTYPSSPSRPYQCELCALSFDRAHDLRRHRDSHTGAKPYACPTCTRTFTRKDALKRHQTQKQCGVKDT